MSSQYDVLVIGSGPAGESAALNAVKHGQHVAIVEQQNWVGGACTHQGTIPSKALRHTVRQLMRFNRNPIFRDLGDPRTLSFPRVLGAADEVIRKQVAMRSKFYQRNRIEVIQGQARFDDPHTLVISKDGRERRVSAENIVIATGSRPYRPA
ncbi:MAG TPA: NAD(P)(+) transhydrogenase, partial [Spongiibacteraceae bacterium]|nr:NAD(P)(+) transhydrogenase [Spongiibacteraceae bacterium]